MHCSLITVVCLLQSASPIISDLDALAKARDVDGLKKYAGSKVVADKLNFVKTGGAYGSGRFGWRVIELRDADRSLTWAVFSTRITNQDIGEQIFLLQNGKLQSHLPESDSLGFKVNHHNFQIWLDPPSKTARIIDKATFRRISGNRKSLMFRMSPHYQVASIKDSKGSNVEFAQAGGVVTVVAPKESSFTYTIQYSGVVNQPRFSATITDREAQLTEDYWYPNIARNAVTYDVQIHSPKGWIAIAQGDLVNEVENASERITKYTMKMPTSYLSLGCAPYKAESSVIKNVEFTTWSLTLSQADMVMQNELAEPIIDYYSQTFGTYPFKRWGSLDSTTYSGGALEAYSFATYATGWLPDDDSHEPAHTWWGGVIPNTYLKSMWNESFAVFCQGLYQRNVTIGNKQERTRAFVSSGNPNPQYKLVTCANGSAEMGPAASSVGYGKGGQVLQVLEDELGTDLMIRCMRNWILQHRRGEVGEWEDFERVVNQTTKRDLKWFFDQWLRRTGWPDISLERASWNRGLLSLKFVQMGEPYQVSADVLLLDANGNKTWQRVRIPAKESAEVTMNVANRPESVSIDPWRKLLRRTESDETPLSIERAIRRATFWVENGRESWQSAIFGSRREASKELPVDLNGVVLIGHPGTNTTISSLCQRVGFVVVGDSLTYKGTTISLKTEGAIAVVELGGNKVCVIAMGSPKRPINFGRAKLCLSDSFGRFLRGETLPKTSGFLTAKVN